VPAAAVIPSPGAFNYVAAVKTPVAAISIARHFEKIGAFIAGLPLYSTAKHDIMANTIWSTWQRVVHGISRGQVK